MIGVLLINLGSPNSPSKKDVKAYLGEFLMDERVIDINYGKRLLLVKGVILNTRPSRSAAAYKKIWTKEGSPLIINTLNLANKVREKASSDVMVEVAMRYGNQSIRNGLTTLRDKGIERLLVIPLYPQYAMSSTETVVEKLHEEMKALDLNWETEIIPPFYNDPDYIEAFAKSIAASIDPSKYDQILFSYHGLPERQILKVDPTKSHCKIDNSCCDTPSKAHDTCYRHQCYQTTKNAISYLSLDEKKCMNIFQSRLGRSEWLKPYTALLLPELPAKGIKKVAIVTPAFVADCLETLEEIAMEGKKDFLSAGGEVFDVIPCLNDDPNWVNAIVKWIEKFESKHHAPEQV